MAEHVGLWYCTNCTHIATETAAHLNSSLMCTPGAVIPLDSAVWPGDWPTDLPAPEYRIR